MASNESYRITPAEIVKNNILFRIPLYQRLFAWRVKEVEQLLTDLLNNFCDQVEQGASAQNLRVKNDARSYYMGMITVVKQGDRHDIIDGQQRTTVLMLLAIGFILILPEGESRNNWRRFFDSSNRVFFNGRSQDRGLLCSLAEEKSSKYQNDQMEEALETIKKFFAKKFNSYNLQGFADAIFNKLTVFVTELPDHYVENPSSLNEYFEVMNSSGKSLEQHEILKVELLRHNDSSEKINLTRLWNVVSNFEKPLVKLENIEDATQCQRKRYQYFISQCRHGNIENVCRAFYIQTKSEGTKTSIAEIAVQKHDFNVQNIQDKEDAILSFPQFLLMVLALHTGNDKLASIHPSKLHDTFRNNPISPDKMGDFHRELLLYRLLLDYYVVRSSSSSHKLICNTEDETDMNQRAHARLRQYQSMLDVSVESHIWVLPLLKYLKSLKQEPTQMDILKFLMRMDYKRRDHSELPDIANLDYDSKPRYWLWRLDYAIWEKLILDKEAYKTTYVNIDAEAIRQYEFRTNRSIEHLHPQNQDNNNEWSYEDVNSFGNLAMISQSFNSQQSNLPVHVKFANLEVQIGNKSLQSLKLYFMYLKAKGNDAEWTATAKNEHAEEMLKILEESLEEVKGYELQHSEEAGF